MVVVKAHGQDRLDRLDRLGGRLDIESQEPGERERQRERERETERETERQRQKKEETDRKTRAESKGGRERKRESMCVCKQGWPTNRAFVVVYRRVYVCKAVTHQQGQRLR